MPTRTRTRPKPAPTDLAIFNNRCTEIARTTGNQCKHKPVDGTDRCRSHPMRPVSAITAASVRMTINGVGWKTWRYGDTAWQIEAWRMYDIIGELRKYANTIGAQVSKCRLYVAEIDENGEPTKEVEDPEIASLAQAPLGKGPKKDEALRLLGINLAVPGEAYIVAESGGGPDGDDIWYVISGSEIVQSGNSLTITRPAMLGLSGELMFREGEDLLIRCWTPHPRRTLWADSSVRTAIPVLRKIEATMKRSFAELDSRLTGAGLLLLPQGIDFPKGDGVPQGIDGLAQVLMNTMATSIEDRASSEAMVPIMATVPPDSVDKVKHLTFWSDLSDKLQEMEDAAIRRLAVGLDIPPEVLTGIGGTNHWNAWAVAEDTIKIFIEPILQRIAEALDHGFLDPTLAAMGLDPSKYTFVFDTAPLAARPNRATEANTLHGELVLSDQAARKASNFNDEDAPDSMEILRRLIQAAIPAKPELLQDPMILKVLGVEGQVQPLAPPPDPAAEAAAATAGQAPEQETEEETTGAQEQGPPKTNPTRGEAEQPAVTAASHNPSPVTLALHAVCAYATVHALGLAGSRLVPHRERDKWGLGVMKHMLHHHHGPVDVERAEWALRGAWDTLGLAADYEAMQIDPEGVQRFLHAYARRMLVEGEAYNPVKLAAALWVAEPEMRAAIPVGASA